MSLKAQFTLVKLLLKKNLLASHETEIPVKKNIRKLKIKKVLQNNFLLKPYSGSGCTGDVKLLRHADQAVCFVNAHHDFVS